MEFKREAIMMFDVMGVSLSKNVNENTRKRNWRREVEEYIYKRK